MRHELRLFFVSLQFLTRVPVPAWVGYDPAWLNQCVRHFPLAGCCVGAVGVIALFLALALFPPVVAVLVSMIATVWLTGAFHEDGLADTCDGLGGRVSHERALEIMKDSRIGTYGAVGLMLALGLKAAALTALVQIDPLLACAALLWSHAASRAAPVWLMWRLPYAGDAEHAKVKPLATQVAGINVAVATGWVLLLAAVLWCYAGGAMDRDAGVGSAASEAADELAWMLTGAAVSAGFVVWGAARWLRRRLGGYTGDTLGAVQQVTEIVMLLAWLALVHG